LGVAFLQAACSGWIINITDAVIKRPNINFQNYRISKLFLSELTRQMAFTFAPSMRVNAIAPGAMLPSIHTSPEQLENLKANIPLKRTGDISAFRDAYAFLVSNSYITGEEIRIDGGWHLS
jgi:NAD(P)-dependent dehydrogenase (short-subunit alcohol dehydrogenase family)